MNFKPFENIKLFNINNSSLKKEPLTFLKKDVNETSMSIEELFSLCETVMRSFDMFFENHMAEGSEDSMTHMVAGGFLVSRVIELCCQFLEFVLKEYSVTEYVQLGDSIFYLTQVITDCTDVFEQDIDNEDLAYDIEALYLGSVTQHKQSMLELERVISTWRKIGNNFFTLNSRILETKYNKVGGPTHYTDGIIMEINQKASPYLSRMIKPVSKTVFVDASPTVVVHCDSIIN